MSFALAERERDAPPKPRPIIHSDVLTPFSRADADPSGTDADPRAHRKSQGLSQLQGAPDDAGHSVDADADRTAEHARNRGRVFLARGMARGC